MQSTYSLCYQQMETDENLRLPRCSVTLLLSTSQLFFSKYPFSVLWKIPKSSDVMLHYKNVAKSNKYTRKQNEFWDTGRKCNSIGSLVLVFLLSSERLRESHKSEIRYWVVFLLLSKTLRTVRMCINSPLSTLKKNRRDVTVIELHLVGNWTMIVT